MLDQNSSQAEFLKDLDIKPEDTFDKPLTTEEVVTEKVETTEETEEEGFKAKNRRERRLLDQNQRLREEAIANAARLQGITEAQKLRESTEESDFLKIVDPIFGTDAPEKVEATNLLKKALKGLHEDAIKKAEERTLEKVSSREAKAAEEVAKEGERIEEILDTVADKHNIDVDSEVERKGFLTLLEKLSPKDKEGNIIEYADPDATAELYLSRKEKQVSRAKDLASRSMTRSGTSTGGSKLEIDANERFLREAGII